MALVGPVSGFAAFEAKVVVKTPLSFLGGEFFDSDGINIHGVWVTFFLGMVVVVSIVLEGEERVVSSLSNLIGSFPNLLEVKSLLVPLLHGGWDGVHGVDPSHKLGRDSSDRKSVV